MARDPIRGKQSLWDHPGQLYSLGLSPPSAKMVTREGCPVGPRPYPWKTESMGPSWTTLQSWFITSQCQDGDTGGVSRWPATLSVENRVYWTILDNSTVFVYHLTDSDHVKPENPYLGQSAQSPKIIVREPKNA